LQSADGSAIKVFGQRTLSLNLGLRRPFLWTFIVASVTDAIIGADFLDNFELTVDIKNRKLCDPRTSLSIQCRTKNSNDIGIRAIFGDTDTQFQQLLRKYPDVIRPTPKDRKVKHNVVRSSLHRNQRTAVTQQTPTTGPRQTKGRQGRISTHVGHGNHPNVVVGMVKSTPHGTKAGHHMETMWGLPQPQCCHNPRPISNTTHSGLQAEFTRYR
jgi:hypothetical protein